MVVPGYIEYQLFPESYFSGCDVSLYIGESWVDEITSLEFSVHEQVQPVYGYNSYTYDTCARGSRTIQGSFGINFREANYLNKILKRYNEGSGYNEQFLIHPGARIGASEYLNKIDHYKNSPDELIKDLSKMTPEEQNLISLALGSKAPISQSSSLLDRPHFNLGPAGFDIVVVYGVPSMQYEGEMGSGAFHKIVGVQLMSCQQIISSDGSPVFEQYSFIAKDLN